MLEIFVIKKKSKNKVGLVAIATTELDTNNPTALERQQATAPVCTSRSYHAATWFCLGEASFLASSRFGMIASHSPSVRFSELSRRYVILSWRSLLPHLYESNNPTLVINFLHKYQKQTCLKSLLFI